MTSGLSYATQLDESVASFSSLVFHTVNVTPFNSNHPEKILLRNWRVTRPSLVRFGRKIFDLVGLRIPEFQVLAPREADLGPCYLWGAVSGPMGCCLLAPFGLDQPKAGKESLPAEGTMPTTFSVLSAQGQLNV